ncbi:MAG TPA: ribbon-helix-helix domain-containing protein [Stellaceae bacterium]|nr:ribbon-helix-helix domain-containing protein [Stellaceae bacterium]
MGKRSVLIAGHRTSVSLEPEFWAALKDLAESRRLSINQVIEQIDASRTRNLSSAIRVFVLAQYRSASPLSDPAAGS